MIDWPFLASLLACVAVGVFLRDPDIRGAAVVMLVNWAACSIAAYVCDDPYPWLWFAGFDYLAAMTLLVAGVLRHHVSRPMALIAIIFAAEIVCHSWQGMTAQPVYAKYMGWYFLKYAAWVQMLIVGGWGVDGLAGSYGVSRRSLADILPVLGRFRPADDEGAKGR